MRVKKSEIKKCIKLRRGVWQFSRMINGKAIRKTLGTGDERLAMEQAEVIYVNAIRENWGAVEQFGKFHRDDITLGEVIVHYRNYAITDDIAKTAVDSQVNCLGNMAALALDISRDDWENVKISKLDEALVADYKAKYIQQREGSDRKQVLRTINSNIRKSKAVFSRAAVAYYKVKGLQLPASLDGFINALYCKVDPVQYVSPHQSLIDNIIGQGESLFNVMPELYVIFCLSFDLGLRASEAAKCSLDWFEVHDGDMILNVGGRNGFDGKTANSARKIPISMITYDEIMGIIGNRQHLVAGHNEAARQRLITRVFSHWMRSHGWTKDAGCHYASHGLRALIGSVWFSKVCPAAAQYWLGHSSIEVTCKHYAQWIPGENGATRRWTTRIGEVNVEKYIPLSTGAALRKVS